MSCQNSYPTPPSYYKDFESSATALPPPRPIEGEFWSNGSVRCRDMPIFETVKPVYKQLYDERKFKENGDAKAEAAYMLLNQLMSSFLRLLEQANETSKDSLE
ncbi:uncharacterized protein [Blastocystis hominis]|uniref:Uncharacterized protein n=1 Tax=Blastocystis hominis TaxID=12968 RepID=D8M7U1_BLAHO|nr:uncharacterized protein [Blastocystis hominis]CBK24130.2 unnamed protein product [Blastocystis hominis]|eukprot:XP_012898178.1 uncharacterized protein [Blastocystis hominis]